MRREEGGAEEGKLLLNEIRTGAVCVVRTLEWGGCWGWGMDTRDVRRVGQGVY